MRTCGQIQHSERRGPTVLDGREKGEIMSIEMQTYKEGPLTSNFDTTQVPIELLYPNPNNPRKKFDQEALDKLTESIRQVGILEPILVVPDGERYRIVAGERRYRAALAAGLQEVAVLIRELTPEQEFEVMLTENLQRADLDPIEEAQAFQSAISRGWKQTELAERLGISQAQVANRIRLLKLPPEIQQNISCEILSAGHGLALLKVAHIHEMAIDLAEIFIKEKLSVAQAQARIDMYIQYHGKPLFLNHWNRPLFDYQETCVKAKCKFRVHASDGKKEHPWCVKPDCWERHQEEAILREREKKKDELRARAKAEGKDYEQLPKLKDLINSDYKLFTSYSEIKLEECPGCDKILDAISYTNEMVKICTDPECWDKKKKTKIREKVRETRERKQNFEEVKNNILKQAFQGIPSKQLLMYMATKALFEPVRSPLWTFDKVWKAAHQFFGWPGGDHHPGWQNEEAIKTVLKHLEKMSDHDLWKVVLFGLLRGVEHDDKVFQLTLSARESEGVKAWPATC